MDLSGIYMEIPVDKNNEEEEKTSVIKEDEKLSQELVINQEDLEKGKGEEEEEEEDQDSSQKMNVLLSLIFEIYRVLMGSMLVLFVPQSCDGEVCTLEDNFNREDGGLTKATFAFNILTMVGFFVLYKIEVSRENLLIDNLDVNPNEERTNEKVAENIEKLDKEIKEQIWKCDEYYKKAGYGCMGLFGINSVLSLIVTLSNYLDDKTLTVLITNILFMGLKINEVFEIVYTEKNIFLSAFLTRKVQFNDIDKDKLI